MMHFRCASITLFPFRLFVTTKSSLFLSNNAESAFNNRKSFAYLDQWRFIEMRWLVSKISVHKWHGPGFSRRREFRVKEMSARKFSAGRKQFLKSHWKIPFTGRGGGKQNELLADWVSCLLIFPSRLQILKINVISCWSFPLCCLQCGDPDVRCFFFFSFGWRPAKLWNSKKHLLVSCSMPWRWCYLNDFETLTRGSISQKTCLIYVINITADIMTTLFRVCFGILFPSRTGVIRQDAVAVKHWWIHNQWLAQCRCAVSNTDEQI